jgi:hypothetical protein
MNDDELKQIFNPGGDEILPSAGFADSVMAAVRDEAAAPAPIAFPWKRAIPLIVVAGITLPTAVYVLVEALKSSAGSAASADWAVDFMSQLQVANHFGAGWIAASLLVAWISVRLSMRLAGVRR